MTISTKSTAKKNTWTSIQGNISSRGKAFNKFLKRRGGVALKYSLLAIFSIAILFGAQGISGADSDQPTARVTSSIRYGSTNVDEIAAAEVAASIARESNMVIADSVTNLADSISTQVQLSGTDSDPYIENNSQIDTDAKTREDVANYTVRSGDTVSSIAKHFGITSDTIRWANDIVGNSVPTGTILKILPVSGIQHKVKSGDTAASLAQKYKTSASSIISFNDAEVDGLPVGETIIIPGGKRPASPAYYNYTDGYTLTYGGNGYTFGYCTWHVANRRLDIGNPVPRGLGNAITWMARAQAGGLETGGTPRVGAVAWDQRAYGDGHVAFVEKINDDGSVWLSHMNSSGYASMSLDAPRTGGWKVLSFTYHTAEAVRAQYDFIY